MKKRILFVEDHPELIYEILDLLYEDYETELDMKIATDIKGALTYLEEPFDLVVLDVMLPGYQTKQLTQLQEGICLGAWICGKEDLLGSSRPIWMNDKLPKLIFLSSRSSGKVKNEIKELFPKGKKAEEVLTRSNHNADELAEVIWGILDD